MAIVDIIAGEVEEGEEKKKSGGDPRESLLLTTFLMEWGALDIAQSQFQG